MADTLLTPISIQVPLVDPKTGTPTPYFQRLLQQLLKEKAITDDLAEGAVQTSRQIISGGGLTGGGDLSTDRTLVVGAGTGITVNADDVALDSTYLDERIRDIIGTALVAGTNITITINDVGDTITLAAAGGGGSYRGALVTKAANQTTANYTVNPTYVAWDTESYDTDSIHDNVTNNSRLTVPSGVTKVRVSGQISLDLVTNSVYIFTVIDKNGITTAYTGQPAHSSAIPAAFPIVSVTSPALTVTSGDYFQLRCLIQTDTSVTVTKDSSWFAMEIL